MSETRQIAQAVAREIYKLGQIKKCLWVCEKDILKEIPLTKNQIDRYRSEGKLIVGKHYKAIGKETSIGGSSRGRKTILYHRDYMIEFVNCL